MNDYERMSTAQSIRALSIKVEDMQRELGALRLDVRRLILLLQKQSERASPPDQPDSDHTKPEPKVHCRFEVDGGAC